MVPLVVTEPMTKVVQQESEADHEVVVWGLTSVEVWSAVARKRREGALRSPDITAARRRLVQLSDDRTELSDIGAVRRRRAADALQLAAALTLVSDRPEAFGFVTLDDRLAEAAEQEAFRVVVPTRKGAAE